MKGKIIEYFMFGYDGTLFDTSLGILKAAKYALNRNGVSYSSDEELKASIAQPLLELFLRKKEYLTEIRPT